MRQTANDHKTGFKPWAGENPRVLILGSLPSDRSIQEQSYYANLTHNSFWKIMDSLFSRKQGEDNRSFITRQGIAMWDVIHSAERKGSMDADIKNEHFNDIPSFIAAHPTLRCIAINGKKALATFQKVCAGTAIPCQILTMPSTSNAFASMPFEKKREEWKRILEFLDERKQE